MDSFILHLSDLHITKGDEKWCEDKAKEIHNILTVHVKTGSNIFICFSGDIVNSGLLEEFQVVHSFISNLKKLLNTKFGEIFIIGAPGNHDSYFVESSVRNTLIESVYENSLNDVETEIVNECAKVQDNFFSFLEEYSQKTLNRISWEDTFELDNINITFKVYNTALFSTIQDHLLGYGKLLVPNLKNITNNCLESGIVVTVFHHPLNWLQQSNMHELKGIVEKTSDIVLTGHEHVQNVKKKTNEKGKESLFVAAEIGKDKKNRLSFSLIQILQDDSLAVVQTFKTEQPTRTKDFPFIRLVNKDKYKYTLRSSYIERINKMPSTITHHKKDELNLDDVYVWPTLKKLDKKDSDIDYEILKPSSYLDLFSKHGSNWVFSEQYMGKSSLLKKIFLENTSIGKVGVIIESNEISRHLSDRRKIIRFVQEKIDKSYNGVNFENTDFKDRILYIDSITASTVENRFFNGVLTVLEEIFNTVLLFADNSYRITELINFEITGAGQYEINHLSGENRVDLVEQWLSVGNTQYEQRDETKIKNYIDILRQAIENNLIPKSPFYMLLLLNNAYALGGSSVDVSSSIALIDKMIMANLSTVPTQNFGQDGVLNFLKELSYNIFFTTDMNSNSNYSLKAFNKFCDEYKKKWKVPLKSETLDLFIGKRILSLDHDIIRFKDSYMYYYFLGNYIAIKQTTEIEVINNLNHMIEKCYREDYSNILVFTSFFSPDLSIFTKVKDEAEKILSKYDEVDLTSKVKEFFNKENIEKIALTVDDSNSRVKKNIGDYSDAQQSMSEIEKEHIHKEDPSDGANVIAKSFRFIQILGQMVKNRSGSIDGDLKELLVKEILSLSARLVSFVFEIFSDRFDEQISELVNRIDEQHGGNLNKGKLEEKIKSFFFYAFQFFTLNVIEKISFCSGAKELKVIFDELYQKNKESNFFLICSLNIGFDHDDNFSLSRVVDASEKVKTDVLSTELFRHTVYKYLTLNFVDYKTKQKLCELCDINIKKVALFTAKKKELSI